MLKNNYKKNEGLEVLLDTLALNGNEREVFALCFLSGPLPALSISKELKINRTVVYQTINQLLAKELLQKENIFGEKQLFNSVSLENIKQNLLDKKEKISDVEKSLESLMTLKKTQSVNNITTVETFNTPLSLRQMLYRALDNSKSKIYLIASVDNPYNVYDKKVFDSFLKELAHRKITLQTLVPKSENNEKNNIWNHDSIKVKFLEKSDYPFSDGLLISDKFLFMFSWNPQNLKGLMISDETIRQTYLSLFFLLWEKAVYSEQKNIDVNKFPKEMQLIPGGYFYFGNELNEKKIFLDSFLIDKTPVTNYQYQEFTKATGYRAPDHWKNGIPKKGTENHPVVNVSWYDCSAYANFMNKRLPTEEEWEKSAKGNDKRIYPWGNNFDINFCNILRKNYGTTPVEKYKLGKSYYDVLDMAGNTWEWTNTQSENKNNCIIKGGSWSDNEKTAQCSYKLVENIEKKYDNLGFRCAKDIF